MAAKEPLSLVYAVPDHPWMKSADKAAVRIAMTVAQAGKHEGVLAEVVSEAELNTDTPKVELERREGKVTPHLRIGADLSKAEPLLANELIASPGVKLHGAGFIVTPREAAALGLGSVPGLEAHILHYRHGRDLAQRPRGVMVIDLFGLTAEQVRDRFPAVYQRIVDRVKPERDQNNRAVRRNNWWLFRETAPLFRDYTAAITRYVATGETAKHRFFQFLDSTMRADNMLLAIGTDSADRLAVLSSRLHVHWAISTGGRMGIGNDPRYSKTRTFDPFPFPLAHSTRLSELGDRLDAFRKERLATHDFLTMTGLYNALERVRELDAGIGAPMEPAERDVYDAGHIAVLKELHDEIDREVFAVYGWSDLGERIVGKPGGTTPSPHKGVDQEAAEEELLVRLVAPNQQRAVEEKEGTVHWLRPEFQKPRLAAKVKGADPARGRSGRGVHSWKTLGGQRMGSTKSVRCAICWPAQSPQSQCRRWRPPSAAATRPSGDSASSKCWRRLLPPEPRDSTSPPTAITCQGEDHSFARCLNGPITPPSARSFRAVRARQDRPANRLACSVRLP